MSRTIIQHECGTKEATTMNDATQNGRGGRTNRRDRRRTGVIDDRTADWAALTRWPKPSFS